MVAFVQLKKNTALKNVVQLSRFKMGLCYVYIITKISFSIMSFLTQVLYERALYIMILNSEFIMFKKHSYVCFL